MKKTALIISGIILSTILIHQIRGVTFTSATFYVNKSGSDSNPCSSGYPCLTIAHAVSLVPKSWNGATFAISITDTTPQSYDPICLLGIQNGLDPTSALTVTAAAANTYSGTGCVDSYGNSDVVAAQGALYASINLPAGSTLSASGGAQGGIYVGDGCHIIFTGGPLYISGAFSYGVQADEHGIVQFNSAVWTTGYSNYGWISQRSGRITVNPPSSATISVPNNSGNSYGGTGVLAKIVSGLAVPAVTTDAANFIPVYVCTAGCTNSGNATLTLAGTATCFANGAITANDYIINATGGPFSFGCQDAGATPPTSGWIVGQAAGSIYSGGTFTVNTLTTYTQRNGSGTAYGAISTTQYGWTQNFSGNAASYQTSGLHANCFGASVHSTTSGNTNGGWSTCLNSSQTGSAVSGTDFGDVSFGAASGSAPVTLYNWTYGFNCNSMAYLEWSSGTVTYNNVGTHQASALGCTLSINN